MLRLAFREMHNGRPGPVHIELPAPILYETGKIAVVMGGSCRTLMRR